MKIPGRTQALVGVMVLGLMAGASHASAQDNGQFELGGHLSAVTLNEFDVTDLGVGFQAASRLTPSLAVDGALTWFPDGGNISSSLFQNQQRVLGVLGLRAGVRRGRVEVFGKARPGFLRFNHQDAAVCIAIAIFPTPLGCQLATGYTAFALDLGGGAALNLDSGGRTFLRVEAGDLMIRYGLEAYRPTGEITDGFVGHNFMVNFGGGWRF